MKSGKYSVVLVAIVVSATIADAAVAAPVTLQPHQALYRMTPTKLKLPGAVSASEGKFLIRLEERCDNWLIFSDLQISLQMEDGSSLKLQSTSTLEETKDSAELSFDTEVRFNGHVVEKFVGVARQPEAGAAGTIEFTEPSTDEIPLVEGVFFPIATYWHSVGKISTGVKIVNYLMYDGSGFKPIGATDISTGTPKHDPSPTVGDTGLIPEKGWRVVSSFFDVDAVDSPPISTNIYEIYENGVTGWMQYDIGLLEVTGDLIEIQTLPRPSC